MEASRQGRMGAGLGLCISGSCHATALALAAHTEVSCSVYRPGQTLRAQQQCGVMDMLCGMCMPVHMHVHGACACACFHLALICRSTWHWDCVWRVNCVIAGELSTLDEVEDDCVLLPDKRTADVFQGQRFAHVQCWARSGSARS